MSADNSIIVHKFKEGYKVAHVQAMENIYWKRGKNKYNYRILKEYFKGSPTFKTKEEALNYANKLYEEIMAGCCPIVEYGIQEV